MDWKLGGLIALSVLTAGCEKKEPAKSFEEQMVDYEANKLRTTPVGRYQFIERVNTQDGIEFRCLDTATGEIGIAFVPDDPKNVKADSFSCK